MGEVIEEVYDIKSEWEKTIKDMEKDACRIRKNNIIFHRVQGGSEDTNVALANFKRVCRENLKMSEDWIQNVDIKEIYHFPAKGGEGTWPLFVSLGKSKHREDLFRASPNLKGSKIVMRNDLAPHLLKTPQESHYRIPRTQERTPQFPNKIKRLPIRSMARDQKTEQTRMGNMEDEKLESV